MNSQHFFCGTNQYAIVADIGGTNARFSRVDLMNMDIDRIEVYRCADFSSLAGALTFYQQQQGSLSSRQIAIAIACPVTHDLVNMTNFHWTFSINEMKLELDLDHLHVMNDFTAAAMSLPSLPADKKIQIGVGCTDSTKPMVVLGAGTGLGVAHLIPTANGFIPLPGEGGHVDWTAQTEQEWFIQRFLANQYDHVSPERLLSGTGLENLYLAIAAYQKLSVTMLPAEEIARLALAGQSPLAIDTVAQFFASLGGFAGDLALTLSAFGGVYIAGGIVPKLLPLMHDSEFRRRFEAKGRFSGFNREIATYVVTDEHPGLLGAAVYLKQMMASKNHGI